MLLSVPADNHPRRAMYTVCGDSGRFRNKPFCSDRYTTKASKPRGQDYFVDRIRMPYGQALDTIALDTKLVQFGEKLLNLWFLESVKCPWERSASVVDEDPEQKRHYNWKIVVGFHQLFTYDYNTQKIKEQETNSKPLLSTLLRYGVDAYMSSSHIHSDQVQREAMQLTSIGPTGKGPCVISLNQNTVSLVGTASGFLLHSVTSLEMVTFFVNRVSFRQRGSAVM